MKNFKLFAVVIMLVIFLAGCSYKSGYEPENLLPYEDQLLAVQNAVDSFQEDSSGLLPIKTRDMETDQYIKYPIDFSKIIPSKLGEAPANSYEAGGIYQYVLMNVEENPTVKLVDLRIADTLRDINHRKGINGFGPIAETIVEGVYKLDYKKWDMIVNYPFKVHILILNYRLLLLAMGRSMLITQ